VGQRELLSVNLFPTAQMFRIRPAGADRDITRAPHQDALNAAIKQRVAGGEPAILPSNLRRSV
jgi:hypothetical protein